MHIALLSHFPGRGGSTNLTRQIIAGLETRGVRCSVIVGNDAPDPILSQYTVIRGSSVLERRQNYLSTLESLKPDRVVRISGVEEFDWLRFTSIPRVSHCSSFESHEYLSISHLVRLSESYVELWTGNTPNMEDLISQAIGRPAAFQLIPYHIDSVFLAKKAFHPADNAIHIAFVGRLETIQKQAQYLPKIIEKLHPKNNETQWEIFGDGPLRHWLSKAFSSRHLDCVRFHDWSSADALARGLQNCHVFFLCSRWEGLPIAMVEAMLCGLAPVVPRLPGGIDWTLKGGIGWMYSPNTIASAVTALSAAVSDRQRLDEMRILAQERAMAIADPDAVETQIDRLVHVLSSLKFNGCIEKRLDVPALRPLPVSSLPLALSKRALRRIYRSQP